MSSPTNSAAWLLEKGAKSLVVQEAPFYTIGDDEVLIRTSHVGIAPLDDIMQKGMMVSRVPTVIGTDVSGFAHDVGKNVKHVNIGDRVIANLACVLTSDPKEGAFQLYCVARSYAICVLPDSISLSEGAVLPLATTTAAMSLFSRGLMNLSPPSLTPFKTNQVVLIWGGSASVGSMAIQLAKAAGYQVATTCSPRNFDLVKSIGADYVFDYTSTTAVNDVVSGLRGIKLVGAFDAAGAEGGASLVLCSQVLAQLSGDNPKMNKTVISVATLGDGHVLAEGTSTAGVVASRDLGDKANWNFTKSLYFDFVPKALEKGVLKPMPKALVIENEGLEAVQDGINRWAHGVSGQKVVVKIA